MWRDYDFGVVSYAGWRPSPAKGSRTKGSSLSFQPLSPIAGSGSYGATFWYGVGLQGGRGPACSPCARRKRRPCSRSSDDAKHEMRWAGAHLGGPSLGAWRDDGRIPEEVEDLLEMMGEVAILDDRGAPPQVAGVEGELVAEEIDGRRAREVLPGQPAVGRGNVDEGGVAFADEDSLADAGAGEARDVVLDDRHAVGEAGKGFVEPENADLAVVRGLRRRIDVLVEGSGRAAPLVHGHAIVFQRDARAGKKFDAVAVERVAKLDECFLAGDGELVLDVLDRAFGHACSFGEVVLAPIEKGSGGTNLTWFNHSGMDRRGGIARQQR